MATTTIEDSDVLNCWAGGNGGMMRLDDSVAIIRNSRMSGNAAAAGGGLVHFGSGGSFLRITGSAIIDTSSGAGGFAIAANNPSTPDFAVQLGTVVVDGSIDISSHGKVLVQNCQGFNVTAVQNASVGTYQSTADYCLAESSVTSTAPQTHFQTTVRKVTPSRRVDCRLRARSTHTAVH